MEDVCGYEENDDTDSSDQSARVIPYEMGEFKPCYIHDGDDCLISEEERLKYMEEQQELLNSSLIALTSHFAQVQLRLRQIVDAPPNEKEGLLKELEEFAFRGIPESHNSNKHISEIITADSEELEEKISSQRIKQKELISKLKSQLEDVEKYAYETGEAGLPQSIVIERQKVIIDQLKGKLNLNIDHIDTLTVEDIKKHVDNAIGQLVNPMKMKEQLVHQLKTQISDLERFIDFLQGGSASNAGMKNKECTCKCPIHRPPFKFRSTNESVSSVSGRQRTHDEEVLCDFIRYLAASYRAADAMKGDFDPQKKYKVKIRTKTLNIMKRIIAILHIFAGSQFGCDGEKFSKNSLKKNMKINHWGDLRADLEMAINEVIQLAKEPEAPVDSDYMSDSEGVASIQCNGRLASAVRKRLAIGIQNLMQHGLMPVGQSVSVVPFIACFPQRSSSSNSMHAWELILKFYDLKNGEQFNSTPARKLSQSFNLDINGGSAVSTKQNLLGVIGNIIATHSVFKRSNDSHFKAFVCAGLNCKMLVLWLRLILRCQPLIELYYQPWSYIAKSGFEDSLVSLEKLNQFHFDLPVDLAIRQLQNIKDAF